MQFEWSNSKSSICHSWIWCGYSTPWCDSCSTGMGFPWGSLQTIVLTGDKTGHLVACIAAHRELDLKTIAKVSGNKRVELLSLDKLEPLTGYVRGGCSPIGMKKKFPTFIEHHAMEQKTIRISAGKRGLQLEIAPQDLQQLTQATVFENHPDEVEAWVK